MSVSLAAVERPDGHRYEHHVMDGPDAAGVMVEDPERGVLAIWRHRFLSDEWAYELPAGMIDPGETPEQAARRECIEESGWDPGPLELVQRYHPIAGQSAQTFWVFRSDGATKVGEPLGHETARVDWLSTEQVARIVGDNQVLDALSVIAFWSHLARRGVSPPSGPRPPGPPAEDRWRTSPPTEDPAPGASGGA
jgi:8-oxo-dGTP pyrophosphatase MutT (NUDIX family)